MITPLDQGERFTVLSDLAVRLAELEEPDAVYAAIHEQLESVLPLTSFRVLVAESGSELREVFRGGREAKPTGLTRADLDRLASGAGEDLLVAPPGRVLATAIASDERLTGWIVAECGEDHVFDDGDSLFLQAVGRIATAALNNLRLMSEAKRLRQTAERLESAAREFGATLELDNVVQRVAAHAHEQSGQPVVVWLLEGGRARAAAQAGEIGAGGARNGAADAANGAPDRDRKGAAPRQPELVTLSAGNRVVGFLAVGTADGPRLRAEELEALRRMAPHAASAIENAKLHAEVRQLSLTDPLVQLPNRRQLDLFLDVEFAAARRGRPLCVVLYDLDRFKQYNDTHGHLAGDEALIRFANVLREETRAMNLAARYGGEEFAVVLSGATPEGAIAHAERVRRRVREEFGGELTVSAGVAAYREGIRSPVDLVLAADRALYAAKMGGRDQVRFADE